MHLLQFRKTLANTFLTLLKMVDFELFYYLLIEKFMQLQSTNKKGTSLKRL